MHHHFPGVMDPDKAGPYGKLPDTDRAIITIYDKSKENLIPQEEEEQEQEEAEENSAPRENLMKCAVCDEAENSKACAGCHSIFYCGKEHQTSDWPNHKNLCKPTKIIERGNGAKFWIAKRDLKPGEIIFIDKSPRLIVNAGGSNSEEQSFSCEILATAFPYNHACAPNCRFDAFLDQEIEKTAQTNFALGKGAFVVVRTILPVSKGEELTVGGGLRYPHLGSHYRRQVMRDHHRFICTCKRCKDPTELGSFTSAISCPKCYKKCQDSGEKDPFKFGYFLPVNPLEFGGDALWTCGKCGDKIKARDVLAPVTKIYDDLQRQCQMLQPGVRGGEEREVYLQGLLQKLRGGKLLHPNHWIIAKVCQFGSYHSDVQNIPLNKETGLPNYLSSFDIKRLENYVERVSLIRKIWEKCSPGWSKKNGEYCGLALAKFYLANKNDDDIQNLLGEKLEQIIQENREALEIFKLGVKIERFGRNPKDITGFLAKFNQTYAEKQQQMESRINFLEKILHDKMGEN